MHRTMVIAVLMASSACVGLELDRRDFACGAGGPCPEEVEEPGGEDAATPRPDAGGDTNAPDAGVSPPDANTPNPNTPDAGMNAPADAGGIACNSGPEGRWEQIALATATPRKGHTMAYDGANTRALLFGGTTDNAITAIDLGAQTTAAPRNVSTLSITGSAPDARSEHGFGHVPGADTMVIYSGRGASGLLSDSWTFFFNNRMWIEGAFSPVAREAITWGVSDVFYFVGGCDDGGARGGGWIYGSLVELDAPPARCDGAGSTFSWGVEVVIGGRSGSNVLGDVWTLGSEWTAGPPLPLARYGHTATWDEPNDRVIVFGGVAPDGSFYDDVWALKLSSDDSLCWHNLNPTGPGPSARAQHAAYLYDNQMYVHGGEGSTGERGDLWVLSF